jgi:hypothetical protein
MNEIHATYFWETMLSTLDGFIKCGNGSDLRMGASTLFYAGSNRAAFKDKLNGLGVCRKYPKSISTNNHAKPALAGH